MPNFKLLLQTFKEEQFSKTLNDIGVKSWKLLLVDYTKTFDFAVGLSLGTHFIIFVDPEDGITHYDIKKTQLKVINILRKIKELNPLEEFYAFRIETINSFKAEFLRDKLLTVEEIESILQKADTLDNLYDKVFGVNEADEVLPATTAAADNAVAPSAAASSSKLGLFASSAQASASAPHEALALEQAFLAYMKRLAPDVRKRKLAEIAKELAININDIANVGETTPSCS